jgi:hypothetical protein
MRASSIGRRSSESGPCTLSFSLMQRFKDEVGMKLNMQEETYQCPANSV